MSAFGLLGWRWGRARTPGPNRSLLCDLRHQLEKAHDGTEHLCESKDFTRQQGPRNRDSRKCSVGVRNHDRCCYTIKRRERAPMSSLCAVPGQRVSRTERGTIPRSGRGRGSTAPVLTRTTHYSFLCSHWVSPFHVLLSPHPSKSHHSGPSSGNAGPASSSGLQ